MASQPNLFSLEAVLGLAQLRGITMGGVLDAIAAERFIARIAALEQSQAPLALTGIHLLPVFARRPELLPAVPLQFVVPSVDTALADAILESACKVDLGDECAFRVVHVRARAAPPKFAPCLFVAELGATVGRAAVHVQVELQVRSTPVTHFRSELYPSALSSLKGSRVRCEAPSTYTAALMTKVLHGSMLDVDMGSHFQLAYLIRHVWSTIPIVATGKFKALALALTFEVQMPLAELLEEHRRYWERARASTQAAQRWSEFIEFRALDRLFDPVPLTAVEPPVARRVKRSTFPTVEWSGVAESVLEFLYRVDA